MSETAPVAVAERTKTNKSPKKQQRFNEGTGRLAALLLSPTLIVLLLVVVLPILMALRQSLYTSGGVDPVTGFVNEGDVWAGLDNYKAIFTGESASRFWNAFYNTTFFTVVCVAIETVIGVAMALVMHRAFRGRGIVRASILVPWAIPTVVSALLWKWIFQADGVANAIINAQVL